MVVAGAVPVAAFVSEQLILAAANEVTLVSVGASWCEPCQRFHRALAAGELDAGLTGFRFIEYDIDVAKEALLAAGYHPKFIPTFALPKSDGTASGQQIEGSVKGDGAVANIVPRLRELAERRPTERGSR
jgi:thiol-disulfide isomerase/thioredoxin